MTSSFILPCRTGSLAFLCNKIFKQEKNGLLDSIHPSCYEDFKETNCRLVLLYSRIKSIFRGSYSRAFLGVLPSFSALRPNMNPTLAQQWRKCPSSFSPLHISLKDTERLCCLCGSPLSFTQMPINHCTTETDTSIISQQLRNRHPVSG